MEEIFNQYLNRLIEFKIYPFAPLEINFLINLGWVLLRSLFKGFSDYRVTRDGDQEGVGGLFLFAEMKIAIFLFSFLAMFAISLSLDFWFSILGISKDTFIWWLPSAVAISLAEISGLITKILPEKEEELEEELVEGEEGELPEGPEVEKTSQLSVYFFLIFLLLLVFWLVMTLKYLLLS